MSEYHLFRVGDKCFLFASAAMRLFRLNRKLYSFIKNETSADPWILQQGRQLYNALRNATPAEAASTSDWYTLNLIMRHKCNMCCEYCFDRMTKESTDIALPLVRHEIERLNKHDKNLCVAFFSGEPLIKFKEIENVVILCEELLSAGKLNRIAYSVTSNGRLLTEEMADFFNRFHFSFTLSADGCNEPMRGTDESQKWFPDQNHALKMLEKYTVRATIMQEQIDGMYQQYLNFQKRGVRSVAFFPAVGDRFCYTTKGHRTMDRADGANGSGGIPGRKRM